MGLAKVKVPHKYSQAHPSGDSVDHAIDSCQLRAEALSHLNRFFMRLWLLVSAFSAFHGLDFRCGTYPWVKTDIQVQIAVDLVSCSYSMANWAADAAPSLFWNVKNGVLSMLLTTFTILSTLSNTLVAYRIAHYSWHLWWLYQRHTWSSNTKLRDIIYWASLHAESISLGPK